MKLSDRQEEALWLLRCGSTLKEIASKLDISEGTVRIHLGSIIVSAYKRGEFDLPEIAHIEQSITTSPPSS